MMHGEFGSVRRSTRSAQWSAPVRRRSRLGTSLPVTALGALLLALAGADAAVAASARAGDEVAAAFLESVTSDAFSATATVSGALELGPDTAAPLSGNLTVGPGASTSTRPRSRPTGLIVPRRLIHTAGESFFTFPVESYAWHPDLDDPGPDRPFGRRRLRRGDRRSQRGRRSRWTVASSAPDRAAGARRPDGRPGARSTCCPSPTRRSQPSDATARFFTWTPDGCRSFSASSWQPRPRATGRAGSATAGRWTSRTSPRSDRDRSPPEGRRDAGARAKKFLGDAWHHGRPGGAWRPAPRRPPARKQAGRSGPLVPRPSRPS